MTAAEVLPLPVETKCPLCETTVKVHMRAASAEVRAALEGPSLELTVGYLAYHRCPTPSNPTPDPWAVPDAPKGDES